MERKGLSADRLRFVCDEAAFDFETTATVPPLEVMIGQARAVKAVEFGLCAKKPGYNIFISGLVGTGKITYAKEAVEKVAACEQAPDDWCYVNNFDNPSQPIALSMPPGMGSVFRDDMEDLVDDLKNEIAKVFVSEDYEQAKASIGKRYQERRTEMIEEFNREAEKLGIMPQWTTTGFVGVPVVDGKALSPEEFQKLDKEQREILEKKMLAVHEKAVEVVRRMQHIEREVREELKNLDSKIGLYAVGHLIAELKEKYKAHEGIVSFLDAVQQDVLKNINDFKPAGQDEEQTNPFAVFRRSNQDAAKERYKVNLLVDNRETKGAPVVLETNPNYYNIVGRVEYETRMSVVSTDYSMIKPGALHKANGGYLILNARDVLANIGAWEALKRVLKTKKLVIENLGEQYGLLAMASLKPQPIPVNVKVIMIGNPYLYHLLYKYDEDFRKLFKVHADFDVEMPNTPDNIQKLVGFISSTVKREQLKDFSREAVARVIEYSTRLAGSQKKLTTRFNEMVELLCEADVWAGLDGSAVVEARQFRCRWPTARVACSTDCVARPLRVDTGLATMADRGWPASA